MMLYRSSTIRFERLKRLSSWPENSDDSTMSDRAVELRIHGLVQGVGYRYFCYREATSRGLTGWVENERDGSVRLLAEGDEGLLHDLIAELKRGPSSAHVSGIEVDWREFSGDFRSFEVKMTW
jgi:acylphosphatase